MSVCVQAMWRQMEALQQQIRQRESEWSVVRRQLTELMRENSELREKLTVIPQCSLVASAQTHAARQDPQTEV